LHLLASAIQYRKPRSLPGHVISKTPRIVKENKCLKVEKKKSIGRQQGAKRENQHRRMTKF